MPRDKSTSRSNKAGSARRTHVSQSDVPAYSLNQALEIPRAIHTQYGGHPTPPLMVAKALDAKPNSSSFRMLCGAAIAYGLTDGGWNAQEIAVTDLGRQIMRPLKDGDELRGRREAFLRPRVVREFVHKYDRSQLPREEIALNVLEDLGVPRERTKGVLDLIESGAKSVGFIEEIRGTRYIQTAGAPTPTSDAATTSETTELEERVGDTDAKRRGLLRETQRTQEAEAQSIKRVFLTHGKNKAFVEPIKKLLAYGELEPVLSVERQTVSKPVPDKVMDDMRTCGAAIIHVDAEEMVTDKDGKARAVINSNVLMEIGAAMALYGRRYILLVREGIELPSNLQGLYEVRYAGESLDGDATIRLLEAINDIKNYPLPQRYGSSGGDGSPPAGE